MKAASSQGATGSDLPPLEQWNTRTIGFRYSLSYVKLFQVRFRALDDPRPFDPDRAVVDEARLPVPRVPHNRDVVAVRHQPLSAPITVLSRVGGALRYAPRQMQHFYTDLRREGGPFSSMSAKTRSTLVRKVRNYEKLAGAECWRIYRSPEELSEFHRLARAIARKTYQERLFDAGLPDSKAFQAEMLQLAERDLVRAFLLFDGDRPVAYLYTPAPAGFLVYEYLGYDPEYGRHSPGTVLQFLALKALWDEHRFPLYYWGYGYTQTKQVFSTGSVLAADIFYFRPSLRNQLAVRLHHATDRFSETTGALLHRLGLKAPINRWLRRG